MDSQRRIRTAPTRVVVLCLCVLGGVLFSGCATRVDLAASPSPRSVAQQTAALLAKYGLHPSDSGSLTKVSLGDAGTLPFTLDAVASLAIGLDMTTYAGKQVGLLKVPLKERSQAIPGNIEAFFVVSGAEVVGAYMVEDGYVPGVVPLTERDEFAPPGLSPQHLTFDGVKSVEIVGPWADPNGWKNDKSVSSPTAVKTLLALLAASVTKQGERFGVDGDEEYMILLTYDSGAVVRARLTTKRGTGETFLTFDPDAFGNWYYMPPTGLKTYVKSLLGVR